MRDPEGCLRAGVAFIVVLLIVLLGSLGGPVMTGVYPTLRGVPSATAKVLDEASPSATERVAPERTVAPPSPTLVVKARKTATPTSLRILRRVSGLASTYGPGYGGLLALPEGPGHRVRICAKACVTKMSNDAGPDKAMQRRGRIADLDVATFEAVCRCSWRTGIVRVTVTYLR